MAFIEGYGIGLAMVILIGPVFFTLLKSTLQNGIGSGMSVALGIFFSDVLCVGLCAFGAISFVRNPDNRLWLTVAGAIVLFALGMKYVIRPTIAAGEQVILRTRDYPAFFAKGFLINFLNPFVFAIWIGIFSYGRSKFDISYDLAGFLGAALLGILTTDTLKVLFAHRIKRFIRPDYLLPVYRVIGVILILFSLRLAFSIFF